MNVQPLFSKADADRILKRAAEIEGSRETGSFSLAELRSIAGEAGLDSRAIDQAVAEIRESSSRATHSSPVHRSGFLIARLFTTRSVPVEATSEQLMWAVRVFHPYREGPAQVRLEDGQITWRDRKGLQFAVNLAGEHTEIRVSVFKPLIWRGRWTGWVKAAADRLETLVYLATTRGSPVLRGPSMRPIPVLEEGEPGSALLLRKSPQSE